MRSDGDWCSRFSQCVMTGSSVLLESYTADVLFVTHHARNQSHNSPQAGGQAEAEWGPGLAKEAVSLSKLTFCFNPEN